MDGVAKDHVDVGMLSLSFAVSAIVALLPVLAFLGALLYLDSYKLVNLRNVVALVGAGALAAGVGYLVNAYVLRESTLDFTTFTRYVSPPVEEMLKGSIVFVLIRMHRVGFLVDAAIFGFGIGTGFSMVENLYYLDHVQDASVATWVVRGFGTALMHGGATAIVAVSSLALVERTGRAGLSTFVPGYIVAVILHSAFNHLYVSPLVATAAIVIALPLLLNWVFGRSERAMGAFLQGFDADAEMLALINSGQFSNSPLGRYLHTLKSRFKGPVVADVLCYLRLYTELSMRAKGILMMRESGFDVPLDDATRAKFEEMHYLEGSIGKTGLLALHPVLRMSHKQLWQLNMLGK